MIFGFGSRSIPRSNVRCLGAHERPELALKSPPVAPAEGPLTEAVLKHARVRRTAARDPQETCREEISPDHVVGGRLQREWHRQV